jgi:hypothetical protein
MAIELTLVDHDIAHIENIGKLGRVVCLVKLNTYATNGIAVAASDVQTAVRTGSKGATAVVNSVVDVRCDGLSQDAQIAPTYDLTNAKIKAWEVTAGPAVTEVGDTIDLSAAGKTFRATFYVT